MKWAKNTWVLWTSSKDISKNWYFEELADVLTEAEKWNKKDICFLHKMLTTYEQQCSLVEKQQYCDSTLSIIPCLITNTTSYKTFSYGSSFI